VFHARLRRQPLLVSQLRGVPQRCLDMFPCQGRVTGQDGLDRRTLPQAVKYDRDRNTGASRAEFSFAYLGIPNQIPLPIRHCSILQRSCDAAVAPARSPKALSISPREFLVTSQ
jgi:hypothetical protein